jgi:hypothetical protein
VKAVNVPGVQRKSHVHICMACVTTAYPNQQQPGFYKVNLVHENSILESSREGRVSGAGNYWLRA